MSKIILNFSRGNFNPKQSSQQTQQPAESYFTFKFTNEKLITLENKEYNRDSSELFDRFLNAEYIINNYNVSYTLKFDPSLNKYDVFSKKHHRDKLFQIINQIDWDNEYKIKNSKKEVNPYETVFESYFDRRSSYKIANLNFLFKFSLFTIDHIIGYTPIMIVGDDGGFSDYIIWHAVKNEFNTKIFVFPEKNCKIAETKFKNEEVKDNSLTIIDSQFLETDSDNLNNLNINFEKNLDLDEMYNLNLESINLFKEKILENTDGFGISLFIAKKFIKFRKDFSQELKYKKFLLLNVILGLSVLSKGGNLVIKIYDMYTYFTVSVLFLLYNYFEKFTIIKPFSTRPHSSSRYVVCQKLTEFQPKILEYLTELYEKYLDTLKIGKDLDFVYPVSKIMKDENFTNYFMEINSLIMEQRIESLTEIKNLIENGITPKYDKMDIKKKCLDQWKIPVLHYDPRQIISNKNDILAFKKSNAFTRLNSIQETAKVYSELDKYSDSIQNMINMFGGNSTTSNSINENLKIEDNNMRKANTAISHSNISQRTDVKPTSLQRSSFEEELLRKKRELLMSSEKTKYSSKKDSKSEIKKKSIAPPKKIKGEFISDGKQKDSRYENFYVEENDMINKKRKIIEESIKNREIVENKKVLLDDNLKKELEKYKKK